MGRCSIASHIQSFLALDLSIFFFLASKRHMFELALHQPMDKFHSPSPGSKLQLGWLFLSAVDGLAVAKGTAHFFDGSARCSCSWRVLFIRNTSVQQGFRTLPVTFRSVTIHEDKSLFESFHRIVFTHTPTETGR